MCKVDRHLGQTDVLDGAGDRIRGEQRLGIGEPDVLTREDDEAAGDEAGVLSGFEHACEPVEARVGIRAADRLDERGDDVVMLVVAVAHAAERERGLGVGERDRRPAVLTVSACATSSTVRRWRASPSLLSTRCCSAASSITVGSAPRPRSTSSSARRASTSSAASSSGSSRNSVLRESSGPVREKNGFSVVAPTRTSRPSSTNGSSTSCWAREKRWTSSRNRIVPCPRSPSRARARSATSRTSFTPALTALSVSNAFSLTPGNEPGDGCLAGARAAPR